MSADKKIVIPSEEDVARYAPGEQPAPGAAATDQDARETATGAGPTTGAAPSAAPVGKVETVEALKAQLAECQDKLLRAQAECANIAKRLRQQQAEALRLAPMPLARDLLPVLDNLERTLGNLSGYNSDDAVAQGVKLIAEQLAKVLKDHGVQPIEAEGKRFDPALHDAIKADSTSKLPHGTVVSELQRGYVMRGRVLRPARVVVSGGEECERADV